MLVYPVITRVCGRDIDTPRYNYRFLYSPAAVELLSLGFLEIRDCGLCGEASEGVSCLENVT